MDRFSRLTDEREILHQLLLRSRCRLHSTDASEQSYLTGDGGDPMQALIRQVFGAFSQYERAVIEVRMKAGMRMKASKGGFTGGRIPYGYRVRGGELEPDPEQLRMVRWVYCARHTKGLSIRQMEAHLMAHGHPDMSRSRIHRILQNEALYRGVYTDRFGASHTRDDLRILDLGTDYDYPEFAE
jgi:DNA invertase Pin-like site-specific DNA recombinase